MCGCVGVCELSSLHAGTHLNMLVMGKHECKKNALVHSGDGQALMDVCKVALTKLLRAAVESEGMCVCMYVSMRVCVCVCV
jgi:hypothetical protein